MKKITKSEFEMFLWTVGYWMFITPFFFITKSVGIRIEYLRELFDQENITVFKMFFITSIGGFCIGFLNWIIELLTTRNIIKRKEVFWEEVLSKSFIYLVMFFCVIIVVRTLTDWLLFGNTTFNEALNRTSIFLQSGIIISSLAYYIFSTLLFHFIKQVSQKFGPGVLWQFITGKYYKPQEQKRIFMFLDLKSSTTIAEKLGHIAYSQLIQDCFKDMGRAIKQFKAEVYQYVGDEVVLTWSLEQNDQTFNCLGFYFAYEETLQDRKSHYLEKYGLLPEFKAGIHLGVVTVAEVGSVKSEIAFHGDVLNTAARIQGECNKYGSKILVSQAIVQNVEKLPELPVHVKEIGALKLRGKEQEVKVFDLEKD